MKLDERPEPGDDHGGELAAKVGFATGGAYVMTLSTSCQPAGMLEWMANTTVFEEASRLDSHSLIKIWREACGIWSKKYISSNSLLDIDRGT